MNMFTTSVITWSVSLGAGVFGLFILLTAQGCSSGAANISQAPEAQLRLLDPKEVVALYWDAALRGDGPTIKRIVGLPGNSMLWDCAPKLTTSNERGKIAGFERPDEATEARLGEPMNNLELILLDAHLIKINRKRLVPDYEQAEYKSFGNEARILYRPKDSPNTTNSKVFFLLMHQDQWRIVDVRSESHLRYVGNKKFGEARDCGIG